MKAASEADPDVPHLSKMAAITLEGLFSLLHYFFSGNGIHVDDFELALQRTVKKDDGGWITTFSLWCLNPSVVFKSIADDSQSVILTSGTLSPLNTFSSELGVQFGTCLEAPHVIDVDSQVWAAAISNGLGNYLLNASYKFADEYAFQDAVGTSLEEICKVVPGGCLVFFPSYRLLDKVSSRRETGQWPRLNAEKSFFAGPRGGSQEYFEDVLKGYYNSIRYGTRQVGRKKISGKKLGLKSGNSMVSVQNAKKGGAAFLAVCRGKVSEGIDFSDDNARVVVIVGIPFPNIYDVKVEQKKKFNDTFESSKKILSGNDWYCQQAFRALNQATGRCIRHRFDYGAIIFLGSCDQSFSRGTRISNERFHKDRNRAYISKWLRKSIRLYSSFEESIDGLKSFFKDAKVHSGIAANSSQDLEIAVENIKPVDKKKGAVKSNTKTTKSSSCSKKVESGGALVDAIVIDETRTGIMLNDDKDASVHHEYIDLECDFDNDLRYRSPPTPLVGLPSDDLELTIVKEMPARNCSAHNTTPKVFSANDYSSTKENHLLPAQSSFQQRPIQNLLVSPPNFMCSEDETPKKGVTF